MKSPENKIVSKELLCGNGATAEAIIRTGILQKLLTALGIR